MQSVSSGAVKTYVDNAVKLGNIQTVSLPYTTTGRCVMYLNCNPPTGVQMYAIFKLTDSANNNLTFTLSSSGGNQQSECIELNTGDKVELTDYSNANIAVRVRYYG